MTEGENQRYFVDEQEVGYPPVTFGFSGEALLDETHGGGNVWVDGSSEPPLLTWVKPNGTDNLGNLKCTVNVTSNVLNCSSSGFPTGGEFLSSCSTQYNGFVGVFFGSAHDADADDCSDTTFVVAAPLPGPVDCPLQRDYSHICSSFDVPGPDRDSTCEVDIACNATWVGTIDNTTFTNSSRNCAIIAGPHGGFFNYNRTNGFCQVIGDDDNCSPYVITAANSTIEAGRYNGCQK